MAAAAGPSLSRAAGEAAAATGTEAELVVAVAATLAAGAGTRPASVVAARAAVVVAELRELRAGGRLSKLESLAAALAARRISAPGSALPAWAWLRRSVAARVRAGAAIVDAAGLPWCGPWRQVWPLELVGRVVERVPVRAGLAVAVVELLEDVTACHLERGEAAQRALVRMRRRDVGARDELGADELARELAACVRRCRAGRVCGWDVVRDAVAALLQAAELRARETPPPRVSS